MTAINKSFCILPFNHLATHPDGKVTPCCESQLQAETDGRQLRLGIDSIDDIRNSDSFTELRHDMLNGRFNSSCNFCYEKEKAGLKSKRDRENFNMEVDFNNIERYKEVPLEYVELRLGNICNAKCIICHPGASSKWNEDVTDDLKGLFKTSVYDQQHLTNIWFRNDEFYNDLLSKADQIQRIWFNGGEPLLIKEHLTFLEKIIDTGYNSNITLDYHTNASLINKKVVQVWDNFQTTNITLSIDDINERFNYQRYPLDFNKVKTNLDLISSRGTYFCISPTVSLLNVFFLSDIYHYYKSRYDCDVAFNYLVYPEFQSITNLPKEIKNKIIGESTLPDDLKKELEYELFIREGQELDLAFKFYRQLDMQRGLNIDNVLPELIELNYDRSI
jgi:MoaA/NifB/PqqE/SkfB family radical SAM enzyme